LPEIWEYTTLGDVCKRGGGYIQTGPFGSQLHASDYVPFGVPSIMPVNIGDNQILTQGIARISEVDAERLSRYRVRPGDIVYSRRGDVERCSLVREKQNGWLCGTGCLMIRLGDGVIDPRFASFYLKHPAVKEWILRHALGATMPNLNTNIMQSVPFILPPLTTQHAISRILGSLDDKIELNRQMNATLEAMARTIFQSWFVDFDPVRAKAEGRQPAGMDAATAALFPDAFEEVDGRKVPRRWRVEPLDQIATFLNGLALQNYPAEIENEYLPVIKIAQMHKGITEGSDRASIHIPPEYIVEDGDVLFSWSGSLEVILWCGGKGALNQHLFKVSSDKYPKWFYYYWVLHHLPDFQLIAEGKATTMGHIQRHHLSEAMCFVPPSDQMEQMEKVMAPLLNKIIANSIESRTLAQIRDALLPKLMSGELQIQNVT